jgi:tRNA threonylcarbamoyladenosine biosynthesis protein TsaB
MSYILHIDTSGEKGFVMVSSEDKVVAFRDTDTKDHAAVLNIEINKVLEEAGTTLNELAAVAVCGGPGSYTGLRIGLATAKGFCYALDKPLMLHPKLELLALQQLEANPGYDRYVTILPARNKEYFICVVGSDGKTSVDSKHVFDEEAMLIIKELEGKTLITGNIPEGVALPPEALIIANQHISKDTWAKFSYKKFNGHEFVNLAMAEPFYLKAPFTHNSLKIK